MKRSSKIALAIGGFLMMSYAASCAVVPRLVDQKRNLTYGERPFDRASAKAKSLQQALTIADVHADSLIWDRDLLKRNGRGQVDLPRLQQANVALQIFSVPTKVPKKISGGGTPANQLNLITIAAVAGAWPPQTWWSLNDRAVYLAKRLHRFAAKSDGNLTVITSADELDRFLQNRGGSRRVGGLLAIEGLHAAERDLERIDRLYERGYRMMGLLHHFDNEIGGSSTGMAKGGLTPFGREVVKRLEERSIIIDLAHASPRVIREVTSLATRPLVISHTGVKGTCDRNRNISDEEIRLIARTGGVVGIGYWSGATCGADTKAVARAIRHAANAGGIDHVALGSDFDGDRMPFDATGVAQVIDALLAEGFTPGEIEKIAGGNLLRVLREALP